MTREEYSRIRRGFAFIVAVLLWVVSNNFSIGGFNFQVKNMWWAGLILSLTITALELVFTSSLASTSKNISLFLFGALGYLYGCVSNVIGIWIIMGNPNLENMFDNPITFIFVVALSCMAEMVPEALLVFSLNVGGRGEGDVIRNLLGINEPENQNNQNNNQNNNNSNNNGNQQKNQNNPPKPMPPINRQPEYGFSNPYSNQGKQKKS